MTALIPHDATAPVPAVAPGASIVQLLHAAVQQGTAVAELKELVDLHERMEARQARQAYFDAMAAFQSEVPQVKKSKSAKITSSGGGGYSFTYAPLDEIDRAIAPHLRKNGLARRWDTDAAVKPGAVVVTCTISHVLGHSESSSVTLPIDSKAGMSDQQKVSAAIQFGERLSLTAVLGLVTSDTPADGMSDPTPITESQAQTIDDMLDATGVEVGKFLKWLGVTAVEAIPAARFDDAMRALRDKQAKGAK